MKKRAITALALALSLALTGCAGTQDSSLSAASGGSETSTRRSFPNRT